VIGGGLLQRRLLAPQWSKPARIGKERVDREGQHAQQQAPAAGAAQAFHQQDPHDDAGGDHGHRRAGKLPAEFCRLAHAGHEESRCGDGREEQRCVIRGHAVERRGVRRGKDQKGEGQHAQDQHVEIFRVELRVADEEAQRELLVHAEEDRGRRRDDEQPAPKAGELAHTRDLGLDWPHLRVRISEFDLAFG
jgi:hypothetical protein